VDGYLARRFDMKSALGAYLDPIADKLLMMTSYAFLAVPSFPARVKVPVWLAVLVISRDVLMLIVALLIILVGTRRRFPPSWVGKVTTVTLILTILLVLCMNVWDWPLPLAWIAFGAAATCVVLSGFDYLVHIARSESRPGSS
jgi:cardiolipin synthase